MKRKNAYFLLTLLATLILGCSGDKNAESTKTDIKNHTVALVDIRGMTCKIGCAGFIQSKLKNLAGVASANVDFDASQATITFDNNSTSEKELISFIQTLNEGQYLVTGFKIKAVSSSGQKSDPVPGSKGAETGENVSYEVIKPIVFPDIFSIFKRFI